MKKKRVMVWRWPLIILNILSSLGLLLAYSSSVIPPDIWWVPSLFGTATAYLLLLQLLWAIFWAFNSGILTAINLVFMASGFTLLADTFQWNYPEKNQNNSLRIVTANVGVFGYHPDTGMVALNRLIKLNPDILCIQEFYEHPDTSLIQFIKNNSKLKYHAFVPIQKHYGLLTISKYPIMASGLVDFKQTDLGTNGALYTDIKIKKQKIRIYNIHLASMRIQPHLKEIYQAGTHVMEEKEDIISLLKKLRNSWKKQVLMVNKIKQHIGNRIDNIYLCGDFNSTPYTYIQRELASGFKDTFREKGRGLGFTFRSNFPLIRIDYIFVPKNKGVLRHETILFPESDHFAVLAEVGK
jgi:endonuclease/exonuclease/phosphatase family metal-dependent hydrolase